MFHLVLPQPAVSLVHVAYDDRHVLEPAIVTARVGRNRPAFRCQVFGQLDELVAESHPYDPHSQPEHPFQVFVIVAGDLCIRYLLEG